MIFAGKRMMLGAALCACCASFLFSAAPVDQAWKVFIVDSDIEQAEQLAGEALAEDPSSFEAHELLALTAKMRGNYDAMYTHSLAMFKHDRMETMLFADSFFYTDMSYFRSAWMSDKQISALEKELSSILNSQKKPGPCPSTWLKYLLAEIYLEGGKLDKAKQIAEESGFIKDWLVIGSFDNKENMGFYESYAPEKEIDLAKEYDGIRWKIKWKKLSSLMLDNSIDFKKVLQPADWALAYVVTYIHSAEARDAALRIGADDAVKAWFNGRQIIDDETAKRCMYDQHVAGVRLNAGWNKLLVKVCQNEGEWALSARLTGADGSPLKDVEFSLDPSVYKGVPEGGEAEVKADGAEAHFKELLAKDPSDSIARYHLARWYRLTDMREKAIKEFEILVRDNPGCALFRIEAGVAYFNDGKPAKGLAELKKAVDIAPDMLEPRFRLARYYYDEKLNKKCETEFKKCIELNPGFAETYLYLGYLDERENRFDEAYKNAKKAVELNPNLSGALNDLGWYAERKGYYGEAEKNYRKSSARQYSNYTPRYNIIDNLKKQGKFGKAVSEYEAMARFRDSPWVFLAMADCRISEKKYAEAEALCRKVLDMCPEHYEAYAKLGVIAHQTGKTEEAKAFWDKSLSYKPDYVWLREYMKSLFPSKNAIFDKYAISDDERERLIQNAPDAKAYPEADGIILLDQLIMQVFEDGSFTEMGHRIVKIATESGRNRFGKANLPKSETLKIKKAVTIKPDGEEIEPTLIKNGQISFANVDEGSIIEYSFTNDNYNAGWLKNQYYDSFYFQWDEGPALKSQFVLAMQPAKELKTYLSGANVEYTEEDADGYKVRIWTAENSAQIYKEDLKPPFEDIAARLLVSTIPSWEYLAKWENSLIVDQFKTDEKFREKVSELTKGQDTLYGKMRALYNYVMTDIRYLHGNNSGIFGVKPHKAVNVLADGYGVCKDKAVLLCAMLREIGVDSYYALVLTRTEGKVMQELPYPRFNHAMVYIPPQKGEKGFFVDPTSAYLTFGDLWPQDQDVSAMVIKNGGYEFVGTPVLGPDKASALIDVKATIDKNGDLHASAEESVKGFFSSMVRWTYELEGRRKEILEGRLNKDLPGAQIEDPDFTDLKDMNKDPVIKYSYTAPSFARKDGKKMYFRSVDQFKLTEWLAKKSDRKFDIRLPLLYSERHRQEFTIPDGWKAASVPESRTYDGPFGSYKSVYSVKGNKITSDKEMALKAIQVKKSDYRQLREFCVNADADDAKEIVLEKK